MFKRLMSLMLALVMLMSVAIVAASAAETDVAGNSADVNAETGADANVETGADAGAETAAANVLNFDPANAGWGSNYSKVFCHVWEYGKDPFYVWQSKGQACTDKDGDGIWTYDLDAKKITIEPGKLYAVIFCNDNSQQTYDLLFDSSCIGGTAYCENPDKKYENAVDSNKMSVVAYWKDKDPKVFGPMKCITSIGNVVGECIPFVTTAQEMFESFLVNNLTNALTFSGKDEQTLIDDTAAALGLYQGNVEKAIKKAQTEGVPDSKGEIIKLGDVAWDASKSSLPEGENKEAETKPNAPTTTTTTGGGSGSGTKTGQSTTMIYVMLGVMIAAAAVIVFSRKRERA